VVLCHRYIGTGDETRTVGNVHRDDATEILGVAARGEFLRRRHLPTVYDGNYRKDDYDCAGCWARHLCGGECYEVRDALGDGFEDDKPYMCDLKRELYAMSIEMMVELTEEKPDLFVSLMSMNAALKHNERTEGLSADSSSVH
jgi:radical SAM protein with 4Fe4S-binding SPASM domain